MKISIKERADPEINAASSIFYTHVRFFFTGINKRKCRSEKSVRDRLYTWIAISTRHGACLVQGSQAEAKFIGHHVSILRYGIVSTRTRYRVSGIGDISRQASLFIQRWSCCVIIDSFLKSIESPSDILSLHKFPSLKLNR